MRIAVDLDGVCYHWERTFGVFVTRCDVTGKLPVRLLGIPSGCNVSRDENGDYWIERRYEVTP